MRFAFAFGSSAPAPGRSSGVVRRLLVLGDLRGNGTPSADSLLDRPLPNIDVDNLDDVLARYAPAVQLGADAGGGRVEFRRLDDFHPDALVETLPALRRLRDVRARLGQPSTFAGAVAELQREARSGNPPPGAAGHQRVFNAPYPHGDGGDVPAQPQPDAGGGLSALDRLLGHAAPVRTEDSTSARSPKTAASAADELIRQAVAPYVVAAPSPQLPQMLAAVDAAMTDVMRAVLHDPGFQAVESAWRAVQWLVSTLDLGETLELRLLHVTRDELASGAAQGGDLWRRLVERESRPGGSLDLSALIGNFEFGPSSADLGILEQMGTMAAALGVPFFAGGSSTLLGVAHLAEHPDPREWTALDDDAEARWRALRTHPAAAHLGLALPRFLLRLPYGKRTDAIDAFGFEEQPPRPEHESFLWGNGAFAYAVAVARALDPDGDPSSATSLEGLPAFVFTTDDGPILQPPAEISATDAAVAAMQARGLMPLISVKDRVAIRLVNATAIAE